MVSPVRPAPSVPAQRRGGAGGSSGDDTYPSSDVCWQLIQSVSQYAVFFLDKDGLVRSWNPGAHAMFGYAEAEIVGQHFSVIYPPDAIAVGHPGVSLEIAASTGQCEETGWRLTQAGGQLWARVVIVAIFNAHGELSGFGQITTDLTAHKQVEEELKSALALMRRSARIDGLTGIANRRSFEESLEAELAIACRHRRPLSVAVIDLDHFKQVNDLLGHDAGDSLLRRAASEWRQSLRPGDVLARYGGEEFAVLMSDTDLASAVPALERLRLATPREQTCSIGVAEWDYDESARRLINRADRAMYVAKATGRNRLVTDAD